MGECGSILLLAFTLDLLLGDPVYSFHPVRLIGKTIACFEMVLRRLTLSGTTGGLLLVVMVLASSVGCYLGIRMLLSCLHLWLAFTLDMFTAYSCMSLQDLLKHAKQVADALERGNLFRSQQAVQKIVGRDASRLDASGIARAAIESVAENFVDGFLSPIFWYMAGAVISQSIGFSIVTGSIIGILGFRTVNTLDSMIGYRNQRYLYFGRAAARIDDGMNFVPARLSVPVIFLATGLCGLDALQCMKIGLRDRLKHPSPNAGHPESCVAGALDIRLGGPSIYSYGPVEKPWLGDGSKDVSHKHIRKCCILFLCSGSITVCVLLLIIGALFWVNPAQT